MNKKYFSLWMVLLLLNTLFVFGQKSVVILHTNDTHSRIEPIPATDKVDPNKGGVLRRLNYVNEIRAENKNVLLIDAGDFLQGTPYFNLFKGVVETEAMNLMKYDVATLGNHEFDYGMEVLEKVVKKAKFPIVCSNYDFSQTAIAHIIKPYLIVEKDEIKIGIIGLGVDPDGLVATDNYKGMIYLPPLETANNLAKQLKNERQCHLIICVSHMGYQSDLEFAEKTRNIDIVIGGHSHTYMEKPTIVKNADNQDVTVFQTVGRGAFVGRIDVNFEKTNQ